MGYSLDLAGYRSRIGDAYGLRRRQLLLPTSVDHLLGSSQAVEHLLKEIYGLESDDIVTIAVRRLCSGVQGNLSDSARLQLDVELGDGTERRYNWFVKIRPVKSRRDADDDDTTCAAAVSDFNVFKNEIEFYEKIVPEMRDFLAAEGFDTHGDEDFCFDVPQMLYAREEEGEDGDGGGGAAIIVLNDVIADGYRHERDENGAKFLSPALAAAALESIALIHAVSVSMQVKRKVALAENHPTLVESGLVWTQADMAVRLGHMKDTYCELLRQSQELDSPTLLSRFRKTFDSEERLREMCAERVRTKDKMTSLQVLGGH